MNPRKYPGIATLLLLLLPRHSGALPLQATANSLVGAQLRQALNLSPRRQAVFDLHIALLDAVETKTANVPNPSAGS